MKDDYISRLLASVTLPNCALEALENLPSADVAPVVHGEWVEAARSDNDWICSVCGGLLWWCGVTEDVLPAFCPNCGALMDKEGDG